MLTPTRPPAPRASEAQLEALFSKVVRSQLGGVTFKLLPTTAGIPDRLVLLPGGRIRLVELKTETGRLSDIQRHLHARLSEQCGVEVDVLYGVAEIRGWALERARDYDPPPTRVDPARKRGTCDVCGRGNVGVRADGRLRIHSLPSKTRCHGSGSAPVD